MVQRLIDAGAIPIGKTNLDQFATGLNGTRSPYGACHNAFNSDYISGGSSSGSAVALAKGMVCFSLGTDTAGSGRVPAAFNNLIGYKPTRGWLSTRGVVPACRSLDCVSIFAFTATDAKRVLEVASGYDDEDVYSRRRAEPVVCFSLSDGDGRFRFGVPLRDQFQFFGNRDTARLFDRAVASMEALGGTLAEVDFAPFLETARLLYEGPRVAERYAAIKDFFELHGDQVIKPVREIIEGAKRYSAADAYNGTYELRRLKRLSRPGMDRSRLSADAHCGNDLYHTGHAAGSRAPQFESWLLHELCEPTRLRCGGGAGWISKQWPALWHNTGGAGPPRHAAVTSCRTVAASLRASAWSHRGALYNSSFGGKPFTSRLITQIESGPAIGLGKGGCLRGSYVRPAVKRRTDRPWRTVDGHNHHLFRL